MDAENKLDDLFIKDLDHYRTIEKIQKRIRPFVKKLLYEYDRETMAEALELFAKQELRRAIY